MLSKEITMNNQISDSIMIEIIKPTSNGNGFSTLLFSNVFGKVTTQKH